MKTGYELAQPPLEEIEQSSGPALLEFGNDWCGYCQAAQPVLAQAFAVHAAVTHWKVADGSGLRLGRAFKVKLWPTLVFLRDGREVTRLVRPTDAATISKAFAQIDPP